MLTTQYQVNIINYVDHITALATEIPKQHLHYVRERVRFPLILTASISHQERAAVQFSSSFKRLLEKSKSCNKHISHVNCNHRHNQDAPQGGEIKFLGVIYRENL